MSLASTLPFSVVIPTWRRRASLRQALTHVLSCRPLPEEILIHVDAGDEETAPMLASEFAGRVKVLQSQITMGPGGGRNILMREARAEYAACFDDDSWPMGQDFFARAHAVMTDHSSAAVVTLREIRPGQQVSEFRGGCHKVASFQNGACLMRRAAFMAIKGYVPLRYAYGMEEADVALQLMDRGWDILRCDELKVFHDSHLTHQASSEINAAHITNTALLAFLRYPARYWPLGLLQTLNRVRYAVINKRYAGILNGLTAIPHACWTQRHHRQVVKAATIGQSRRLARQARSAQGMPSKTAGQFG